MSSFTTPLVVTPLPDGRRWRLFFSFQYHIGSKYNKDVISVPAGFVVDFASIPKFIWWLPYWAKYSKPSIIHDALYQLPQVYGYSRKEADDIFYEAMLVAWRDKRWGRQIARLEYWAVRIFGFLAWRGE